MSKKIKILFNSNYSRALTGFGKNAKNVLRLLSEDERFEVVEAANGVSFSADLKTPWKSYGTYPNDPRILQEIEQDQHKKRLAEYGNFTIDQIIKKEKPDIVVGVEDVWAFDWVKKKWFDKLNTVIWTTLDSSPILDQAYWLAPKVNKFLVWASFAEEEMSKRGFDVETVHGAIDYSSFFPLKNREELRKKHSVDESFLIGFVFKNQLRKSVPNLLEGFKLFKETESGKNAKLLLHTDWPHNANAWDIEKYINELNLDKNDILATYICRSCKDYSIKPYQGEEITCDCCGIEKGQVTKNNGFGVSEEQLNEIYNLMDVYCHPFTSGGQELPIQEAKSAGLITLATEYSCGTDSCYEKDGGMPLKWVSYREPLTQFIKATTLPTSIAENLEKVKNLSKLDKHTLVENAINCVSQRFSVEKAVGRLKEIFLELGKTDWDFDFEDTIPNCDFSIEPDKNVSDEKWVALVYKGFFDKKLSEKDIEVEKACEIIKKNGRQALFNFLKKTALEKKEELTKKKSKIEDFFSEEDEKRVVVVMPESAGDVLLVNSLISNLKKKHKEHKIYFVTDPKFYPMISSHPDIENLIPYQNGMDNFLFWEGKGEYKGYADIAYLPFVGSQRFLNYLHGPEDEEFQFNLYSTNFER